MLTPIEQNRCATALAGHRAAIFLRFVRTKDLETTDKIVAYLKDTYQPDAIIAYGSFADGSANKNSDFDALVIADSVRMHDSSVIDSIVLDVFIYPLETFQSEFDPEKFVQVWNGKIILDTEGIAARVQKRVLDYIAHIPQKTEEEIRQEVSWCEKMLYASCPGEIWCA